MVFINANYTHAKSYQKIKIWFELTSRVHCRNIHSIVLFKIETPWKRNNVLKFQSIFYNIVFYLCLHCN